MNVCFPSQTSTAPTLSEEPLERNVSFLCSAQFASSVGCSYPTVRLRQLEVFNILVLVYFIMSKTNSISRKVEIVGVNRAICLHLHNSVMFLFGNAHPTSQT